MMAEPDGDFFFSLCLIYFLKTAMARKSDTGQEDSEEKCDSETDLLFLLWPSGVDMNRVGQGRRGKSCHTLRRPIGFNLPT